MPFAKPAAQVHWYACSVTLDCSEADSEHVASFWHGLLAHSLTSMSQFPLQSLLAELSDTVHSAMYSVMKSAYPHMPFAKPAAHVQVYASMLIDESTFESVHTAPFSHG